MVWTGLEKVVWVLYGKVARLGWHLVMREISANATLRGRGVGGEKCVHAFGKEEMTRA